MSDPIASSSTNILEEELRYGVFRASRSSAWRQVLVTVAGGLSGMAVGNCMGWPSPSLEILLSPSWSWPLTGDQSSWVVSLLDLGVVLGCLPAGWAADRFGRKPVLLFCSVPFVACWILTLAASRVEYLYAARLLSGLASSVSMIVTVMYVGEISENRFRGANSTLLAVLMSLGMVFSYCLGPYVSYSALAGASLCIPIFFVASFAWAPESPYFLLMQGKRVEATKALTFLRGKHQLTAVEHEIAAMEDSIHQNAVDPGRVIALRQLLFTPGSDRTAFAIVMVLIVIQSLSGFSAVMAYSAITLPGGLALIGPNEFVIFFGIVSTLATLVSALVIDRAGRRPLLLVFCSLQALSLLISATYYSLEERTALDMTAYRWIPALALLLYGVSYPMGLGSVPNALQVELFSTQVKGIALPTILVVFNLLTFAVSKTYEVVSRTTGKDVAYWFFCVMCVIAVFFTVFKVKETKGKSFLEIQMLLDSNSKKGGHKEKSDSHGLCQCIR